MNLLYAKHRPSSRRRNLAGSAAVVIALLGFTDQTPASAATDASSTATEASTPLAQAAQDLRADYRQQQWQRLAQAKDRDSLIAAVLLGMPTDDDQKPIEGHSKVEDRLARTFGHDELALFTLALACQAQSEPCAHPESYAALVRLAPDNAVNWLLLPNGQTMSDAQLHSAAAAKLADSHLRDFIRITRAALADQPAPALREAVDPRELGLLLRRETVDEADHLPLFKGAVVMCKAAVEPRRSDCLTLGRQFEADRSGAILSSMIGVTMVRRLVAGTQEDADAKELRRDYVWLSDLKDAGKLPDEERLQNEIIVFGEWEAWKRGVERMGSTRTPPTGWMPKNPLALELPESRTPEAAK